MVLKRLLRQEQRSGQLWKCLPKCLPSDERNTLPRTCTTLIAGRGQQKQFAAFLLFFYLAAEKQRKLEEEEERQAEERRKAEEEERQRLEAEVRCSFQGKSTSSVLLFVAWFCFSSVYCICKQV